MRCALTCFVVLLSVAFVIAQGNPEGPGRQSSMTALDGPGMIKSSARQGPAAAHISSAVRPDTPVVMLKGVCDRPQKGGGGCKTVITRAEIDSMLNLLEPDASPVSRRQFAINYARLVAAFGVAQRRHLEKDPAVASAVQMHQKLVRMQVLADILYHQIEAQAKNVSPSDIEKYYAEHRATFEQGEVWRLSIPKSVSGGQPLDLSGLKAKAEELRTRGASGEDFDQLQEEAYRGLELKFAIPPTKLKMVRRISLPSQERIVFDLDPGEVTDVLDSPRDFIVLKLVSKWSLPLESARAEIMTLLGPERAQQEVRNATQSSNAEFDLEYLGLPSAPELFPPPELAQLTSQQGTQSGFAQGRMPSRRRMVPGRRGVTVLP